MKKTLIMAAVLLGWLTAFWSAAEQSAARAISVSELLKKVQTAYSCGGFKASFQQESTLKAMNITDTASGKAYFKEPGMMRWEYIEPDPQQIITDGKKLWIYKPLENQVMIGDAPALFGEEQGVNFMAAINTIEEKNRVTIDLTHEREGCYCLKLEPHKKTNDMAAIYLYFSRQTGLVQEIETTNAYDDHTRIMFSDIQLGGSFEAAMFTFHVPADADVMVLDNQN